MYQIRDDDLTGELTRSLLAIHLGEMHHNSPPGYAFALDLSGLQAPNIKVWSAWQHAELLGIAALKDHENGVGELKSMRTHPRHLRKGVAAALLEHIVQFARKRGMHRLSLETGSGASFDAALALYRKRGFVNGEAFGDYQESDFNQFLHLEL